MLLPAPLAFCDIAGEQYDNGMKVRTGKSSHPVIRVIRACGAEDRPLGQPCLDGTLPGRWPMMLQSTPSARKPFQVKPTVTHLESRRLDPTALAVPTLSIRPVSHARPPAACRNVKNSYRAASAGGLAIRKC